jgi:hypothetical protein
MSKGPEQNVIVYDAPGISEKVYATAYGQDEARAVVKRCASRHGHKTNPRPLLAIDRMKRGIS